MLTVKNEDGKLNIRYAPEGKMEQQISIPVRECEHLGEMCDEALGITAPAPVAKAAPKAAAPSAGNETGPAPSEQVSSGETSDEEHEGDEEEEHE